ncbi:MAG: ABC transporter ATP-binding protein, partial [Sphingobacteriaceae bacterium]
MAAVTGKAFDTKLLSRVLQYVRPYRRQFLWAAFLTVLMATLSPIRPYLIQVTVDKYILTSNFNGLLYMSLLMFGLLVLQSGVQYFQTYLTNALGQSVILQLRTDVFNHITQLRLKYFDHTPIGVLITRSVSDLETIADIFSEGLISIIGDMLQLIALIGIMLYTDWRLTLITLIPMPLLMLATYWFKEAIKSSFQEVRTQVSHLNTFLQEHISGMSVIHYFAREDQE